MFATSVPVTFYTVHAVDGRPGRWIAPAGWLGVSGCALVVKVTCLNSNFEHYQSFQQFEPSICLQRSLHV
jgi:hypothetical protein